ncbi:MAG: acyltransferase [Candidatus Doudnabacteria bacterium]|nr:acyltransferase [Candidatus Doudnabacteria bacterium]
MEVALVSEMTKSQTKAVLLGQHIQELDGVRAIAIWMVLIGHLYWGFNVPDDTYDRMPRLIYQIISHGWLGVDLFFILSGFLISGILLDSKHKQNYFRTFYWRRALRILPIFYLCIFVMSFFYGNAAYFILSLFFLANFAAGFGVQAPHGPGVFWSLCIEEHFYLLWPFLVKYLSRRNLTILAGAIVILTPALRWWGVTRGMGIDAEVYSYSWFRFDGLAMGALLAIWARSGLATLRNSFWLAGLMLIGSVVIAIAGMPYGIMGKTAVGVALRYTQVILVFGAFVLTIVTLRGSSVISLLRTRFTDISGKLSYCLYLIHLSVGDAVYNLTVTYNERLYARFGSFGWVTLRGVIILVASFAIALLSQRFIEGPFLKLKKHFV